MEILGFNFVKERHGGGPAHYSSQDAGFVFELYPLSKNEALDNSRVGFSLNGIQKVLSHVKTVSRHQFNGRQVYIVEDPDGRKVELSE